MGDTLRSIAEGMEHTEEHDLFSDMEAFTVRDEELGTMVMDGQTTARHSSETCPKCRLEALLAEYEKVDLVEKLRSKKVTEMSYPLEWSDKMTGEERDTFEALVDHIFEQAAKECANDAETWLAVKSQACDLVKTWQQFANEIDDGTNGVTACSASAQQARRFADELETWLAVNLERIKAEARLARKEQVSK